MITMLRLVMGRIRKKSGSGGLWEFPKFENSGSGISGMKKVGFGRVREFPKFKKSGSGLSVLEKLGFGREFSCSGIPGPITSSNAWLESSFRST